MKFLRFNTIKSDNVFSLNIDHIAHFYPKRLNDGVLYTVIVLINNEEFIVSETFDEVFNLVNPE